MKVIKGIIILVLVGAAVYGAYWSLGRLQANRTDAEKSAVTATPAPDRKASETQALIRAQVKQERADRYNQCMNKAYRDYQARYNEECSKVIIDGVCRLSQQQLHDVQSYYTYDKNACEKLKP